MHGFLQRLSQELPPLEIFFVFWHALSKGFSEAFHALGHGVESFEKVNIFLSLLLQFNHIDLVLVDFQFFEQVLQGCFYVFGVILLILQSTPMIGIIILDHGVTNRGILTQRQNLTQIIRT